MSIYFLTPALKQTIWGGDRLKRDFGMQTQLSSVAEAWMLSCHEDGESVVRDGEFEGQTLSQLIERQLGIECLGTNCEECKNIEDFPILIKLIDAADTLSVQVHPDDEYAKAHEKDVRGKTEAWYIIDCDEGASLIYGFREDITREEFRSAIESGTLLDKVNSAKVKPGDVAFIPAGTLHAIGKGILLAEVQQSCNTTYRVFDYNRKGLDGKPRELHIDKAVDVTDCCVPKRDFSSEGMPVKHDGYTSVVLAECPYFTMSLISCTGVFSSEATEESFVSLIALDGSGLIWHNGEQYLLKKGDSVFIPADSGSYQISGRLTLLHTQI